MHLKQLQLSGFKSFARPTVLEFPRGISAIVGPNGSGKSNIKEAIQWVMGEQSMKSLRGKKGEDLIWSGSPASPSGRAHVPRMGKASVGLLFDNTDGALPIEFREVLIERKIFRDGLNEYSINRSQVRLRDVVEFMARIGLGEMKHNIVGQGEVDRMLLSNSRERKAMLEEALGLRVYQLKKNEALRKLAHTTQNMERVEALLHEIVPHLKFLKVQAEKAERRGEAEKELRQIQKAYFVKERNEILRDRAEVEKEETPLREHLEKIRRESAALEAEIASEEEKLRMAAGTSQHAERAALEKRRRELERELGRLEGKLEVARERAATPVVRAVNLSLVESQIRSCADSLRRALAEPDLEAIRARVKELLTDLDKLILEIREGISEDAPDGSGNPIVAEIEETVEHIRKELLGVSEEIEKHEKDRSKEEEGLRARQLRLRTLDGNLRALQEEERDILVSLERVKFSEEKVRIRESVFREGLREANIAEADLAAASTDGYDAMPAEDFKKKIERLRARLEEIGGIDPAVVQEYRDTNTRYEFLDRELTDLKSARSSLEALIEDLEERVEKDFAAGFAKVKDEFHNYFRIIFGGGRASLSVVKIPVRGGAGDAENEDTERGEEEEGLMDGSYYEGIEMIVDLPRKRIRGLSMLSGGERALTSIALLFAITAVNPPPFLILDETDAALDEANSQRYAAILKELAKKTQLILVTHNRETMKCADILYGVTMGDDGVSKLLSLKFEEAAAYTNR